jgi:hypothetical protein
MKRTLIAIGVMFVAIVALIMIPVPTSKVYVVTKPVSEAEVNEVVPATISKMEQAPTNRSFRIVGKGF